MKVKSAVMFSQPGKWEIVETTIDRPRDHEVLVRIAATGLCHSDDHIATGDALMPYLPLCGGHEGAGIVEEIGPGVRDLKVGDHIVTSFIPSCGHCRWCSSGMQNLCDTGALMMTGAQLDGTYRKHVGGMDVGQVSFVGTFSELSIVPEWCCVKIPPDFPLRAAALVGCGVPTGWGSAVNAAAVQPGETVIVIGIGGIGINAIQGARHAGATYLIAVDPVAFKRESALGLGATHAFSSIDEAADYAKSVTNGQGADSCIVTVGVLHGEVVRDAFSAIRKGGTVVVTAVAPMDEVGIPVSLFETAMWQKRIQGAVYGMMSPFRDVPRLLQMYTAGDLKLDELITRTYSLEEINQGYEDMRAGINIRGLVTFD